MSYKARIFLSLLILPIIYGCSTNPYTGRTSLHLTPAAIVYSEYYSSSEQLIAQLGATPTTDEAILNRVNRVSHRLIEAAKRSKYAELANQFKWEVHVYDAPGFANALALPGGRIVVFSSLLDVTTTDEELAAIIGHELTHALARHASGRYTTKLALSSSTNLLTSAVDPTGTSKVDSLIKAGVAVGLILPYTRATESEADYIGLLLAADAGYDPQGTISFWQKMAVLDGEQQKPEYLSTHPSHETRINQITAWLPEANPIYQSALKTRFIAVSDDTNKPLNRDDIREIQRLLNKLDFDAGSADGLAGKRTKKAISAFQAQASLPINAETSWTVLHQLREASGVTSPTAISAAPSSKTRVVADPNERENPTDLRKTAVNFRKIFDALRE